MYHSQSSPFVITRVWLWAAAFGALLGTGGCADPQLGGMSSSPAVRALRNRFPEQAPTVLQQEHSFKKTEAGFILKDPGAEGTWRSAQLELPLDGKQMLRFKTLSGLEIRVREIGAEGPGEIAEQSVSYPRRDGTSYWAAVPGAYEEWLHLGASAVKSGAAVAVWHVEGAELRQAGEAVELVDRSGAVQMRVTAPEAYAAQSGMVKARLSASQGRIDLHIEADGEDVLVDPIWGPGGPMMVPRASFTATALADGRVLTAGGINDSGPQQTAETYNPTINTWSATANTMADARRDHAAVLMWNNKVLVTGGWGFTFFDSAEVFDPMTNLWSSTAPMSIARWSPTAVQLGNGKVLVAGGYDGTTPLLTELYDPAASTWSNTGNMITGRCNHTATLLGDGKVLVAGGDGGDYAYALKSAEVYDMVTGTWTATGDMTTPRSHHTATLLVGGIDGGKVLVTGGVNVDYLQSAELYDPATKTWSSAGVGPMSTARFDHTATRLDNGRVLVVAGFNGIATVATAEQYNPATKQFSSAGSLVTGRYQHEAAPLQGGKVLITGGYDITGESYLTSIEIYLLPLGSACVGNAECQSDLCVDGLCCNAACGNGDNADCQACNTVGAEGLCSPSSTGFVCRAAGGVCDVTETCDGVATTCPADAFAPVGLICRDLAPGSICDVVESCTGNSGACPADGFLPAGMQCRAAVDICDVAESCIGSNAFCPADTFVAAGAQCRAAVGVCDVTESCTGSSPLCPPDAFVPAGTYCLNGPGLCSAAHACTGDDATCP